MAHLPVHPATRRLVHRGPVHGVGLGLVSAAILVRGRPMEMVMCVVRGEENSNVVCVILHPTHAM